MYEIKQFNLPSLEGISDKTIEAHLGLYAGYVKNVNHIHNTLPDIEDKYARQEMQRRLGFEFGGMKNHEAYFAQFEGGNKSLPEGTLHTMITAQYGSLEGFIDHLKQLARTRGVGWVMCYLDTTIEKLVTTWVDEQHLGHLVDTKIVLALDMWEHSYVMDYLPSEKGGYVDAFFNNLNWEVVAKRV